MKKHTTWSLKYQILASTGWVLILFVIGYAIVMVLAEGDTSERLIHGTLGLIASLFGIWLIRRVEKNIFRALAEIVVPYF